MLVRETQHDDSLKGSQMSASGISWKSSPGERSKGKAV
jgi:hypothetical protein